jgi:hypothetical protein
MLVDSRRCSEQSEQYNTTVKQNVNYFHLSLSEAYLHYREEEGVFSVNPIFLYVVKCEEEPEPPDKKRDFKVFHIFQFTISIFVKSIYTVVKRKSTKTSIYSRTWL